MSQEEDASNVVQVGSYIVIQRQGYFKLHQLSPKTEMTLGNDKIDLSCIIGKPFWTMYKMIPCKNSKRQFNLEVCSNLEDNSEDIIKDSTSGVDNRNLTDDGKSQSLTGGDIDMMRNNGLPSQVILEKIIENSKTFKEKTEYSQEKYLRKKEKKYFQYIIVREPTIRLLSDIFYSRDQQKILGLRHDAMSQIYTYANIQSNGVYALFDNGTQGLVGAGILNLLSSNGLLINFTIGNHAQKQAILAMNFEKEKLSQFVSVKLKDVLNYTEPENNIKIENGEAGGINQELNSLNESESISNNLKRKLCEDEIESNKKPRWSVDLEKAMECLKQRNLNAIIIVAKEYPLNLLTMLIPYLKISCPLVIYSYCREPLVELYLELKKRKDIIKLHLVENFLRYYQVLPDRTHPDVSMNCTGHLLTGIKILQ